MRKFLVILIFIGFAQESISQEFVELKKVMKRELPDDSNLDGRWVYEEEISEIEKIETDIEKYLTDFEFYKVRLVNYLGWHINDTDCLVLFNKSDSSIILIEPLWYGGVSKKLIGMFIDYKFQTEEELQKFVFSLQDLLLIGSKQNKDFRNTVIGENKITFDLYETNRKERIWRKIEIGIDNYTLKYLNSINPVTKKATTIE